MLFQFLLLLCKKKATFLGTSYELEANEERDSPSHCPFRRELVFRKLSQEEQLYCVAHDLSLIEFWPLQKQILSEKFKDWVDVSKSRASAWQARAGREKASTRDGGHHQAGQQQLIKWCPVSIGKSLLPDRRCGL